MTFETPRFTEKKAGPCPKFRGMIVCPRDGFGSKAPNGVTMTPGLFRSVAKAGRSVKKVSPFVSCPVMILNGMPELATIKVFTPKPERVDVHRPLRPERAAVRIIQREFEILQELPFYAQRTAQ